MGLIASRILYRTLVNAALPTCAGCNRPMYRNSDDLDRIAVIYPFRDREGRDASQLGAVDWDGLNRDYGWQSAWAPSLCRACDTEHDHRRTPSIWQRLMRRLV